MSDDQSIANFLVQRDRFNDHELNKLYRKNLGDASIESALSPYIDEIRNKIDHADQYSEHVPPAHLKSLTADLTNLNNHIDKVCAQTDSEFINGKESHIKQINTYLNTIKSYWYTFVSVAVEEMGLLDKNPVQKLSKKLQSDVDAAIIKVEKKSKEAIESAEILAKKIETQARNTATGVSVKDAQDQFNGADAIYANMIKLWTILSIISGLALVSIAIVFLAQSHTFPNVSSVIYFLGIRLVILGTVGAVFAYCLRNLSAQMHLRERNVHRIRLANSLEGFVASAGPDQRDYILSKLVDEVAYFGNSGIISDNQVSRSQPISIESITRGFRPPSQD